MYIETQFREVGVFCFHSLCFVQNSAALLCTYVAEVKIKGVADTWYSCHSVSNTVFALGVFHSMCLNI